MVRRSVQLATSLSFITAALLSAGPVNAEQALDVVPISSYAGSSGAVEAGTEIVAFDPGSKRAFSTNDPANRIDVTDLSNPANPTTLPSIELSPYGTGVQSVAANNGLVAAAVKGTTSQDPGSVVIFDSNGKFKRRATVGALPDMVTLTPNGLWVLAANEGEPACAPNTDPTQANNPEGSVSIVNTLSGKVRTVGFASFNNQRSQLLAGGVRLNWPGATVAQDLEPENIATNGITAWVTLQENNAIAVINVLTGKVSKISGLGTKDHSVAGQGLDPSDKDSAANKPAVAIGPRPVSGLYMPDGIAFTGDPTLLPLDISEAKRARAARAGIQLPQFIGGSGYLFTANEGDGREYPCFSDESRLSGANLDPAMAALKGDGPTGMGRLTISVTDGDTDGDRDIDRANSFGARSFSVRNPSGRLIWDSGDQLEQLTSTLVNERSAEVIKPLIFNADYKAPSTFDNRSDNKGPEPESVVLGQVRGKKLAFISLERIGGVATYDVSDPSQPKFLNYANPLYQADAEFGITDRGPEGLQFVAASQSPSGKPLLLVANEISGTVTVYEVRS